MVSRIPAVWYRLLLSRLDSVIKVVPEKRQVSARKKDVIVLIPIYSSVQHSQAT